MNVLLKEINIKFLKITVLNPENVLLLYDFIDDNQYDGYMEKLKNIEIIWTDKKNRLIASEEKI